MDNKKDTTLYNQTAAVALKYNPELNYAPVIVASGLGEIAKKIVSIADEHGVPIYRDDSVTSMLVMLQSGSAVPPELYSIVASIYSEIVFNADDIATSRNL
ncbi:MAG: EscU/YscU/HrcU family type III secretion system export apparatus switch protein [Oscillospiraceae bacterium]|jgi:flagellar biosynthesis protein|nr:EscU/YscU/HrcU family type III secretion system export apparatus switch protein [Oscillospiraceae bacterium]